MGSTECEIQQRVAVEIPPIKPFFHTLNSSLKETLFPDDPLKQFKKQPFSRKLILGLKYFIPILEWAPRYTLDFFKSDFIAGITTASLAVPQGISYASLANLPPVVGLYSSCVPPLIYAMLGSSRDLAVGNIAVPSLLISSMIGKEVNPHQDPKLYVQLVFAAAFFAGVFQAALGLLRLGFIVDFLSHATIVGFMSGAATVVCLQQLKSILGLVHFTHEADIVSVLKSVFTQVHMWRWESGVLGCCFLFFLSSTRYLSRRKPALFWINALGPLVSVILGSLFVYFTHAENHGVQIIGHLKKGLNPQSVSDLTELVSISTSRSGNQDWSRHWCYLPGVISLAEAIAVGRSFATFKSYHIDGNKEMIAIGMMNIAGSCTSCYLTAGPFSRTAVNSNAGSKTAVSNIVMSTAVMMTLLFMTPLFYYTPLVVLSATIIVAMISIVDYEAAFHLWGIDKFDFIICLSAYVGVVFAGVETGLVTAVAISLLRVLLFVARPRTCVMGNVPNSMAYRSIEQYPKANYISGILVLNISAPIYFANANYLRERISRWIDEEEDKLKCSDKHDLQHVILDMSAVGCIDTSGISMLQEIKKFADRKCIKLILANPGGEVMKKLNKSKFIHTIGQECIYLTVQEAVSDCNFMLQACKPKSKEVEFEEAHEQV